jgi:hypothetical protein
VVDQAGGAGTAGPDGAPPAGVVGGTSDEADPVVVAVVLVEVDGVPVGAGPGREMDLQVGIPAPHPERGARGEVGQGPFDEDVGPAIEPEVLKVDSRTQR